MKRLGIVILCLIVLLTLLIFSLRLPAVQNFIKDKLIVYLENKIKTDVELERVYIDFPNSLVMENLYLQGEDIDTLLFAKKLDVGLDLLQLINNKADLKSIDLEGTTANIVRRKDGSFNFDYIINAFVTEEKEATESKPFIISLDKIKLKNIQANFIDQQAGNSIKAFIGNFDTWVKKFDLQENTYAIDKIMLNEFRLQLKQDLVQEIAQKVDEKVDSLSQQKPMQIQLGEIDLSKIDIDYGDDNSGMYAKLKFDQLQTQIKTIDLQKNNYAVGDIRLHGLDLDFNQKVVQDLQQVSNNVDSKPSSEPIKLALGKINLNDIKINYGDAKSKTYAKVNLDELETKINALDLAQNKYDIEDILLKNATIDANLFLDQSASNNESNSATTTPLQVLLNQASLENVKVKYNNTATQRTNRGMDFNHLDFSQIALELRDFKMMDNAISGRVKSAEIKEESGLHVQEFRTEFLYAAQEAHLKKLYLKTPRTLLRDEVIVNYQSLDELAKRPENAMIRANIKNSRIGFADILTLVPDLRNTTPFKTYPNEILEVNTKINGSINDLKISYLQVKGFDDLHINASGIVKNAMDMDRLNYDLNIKDFSTSSKTIYKLLPQNTIPNNIRIPSRLAIKGKAKGTLENINTQAQITSTLGNATIDAQLDMRKKDTEKYQIAADVSHLDIGTLISNNQVGKITGTLHAKGQSFDLNQAVAQVSGNIQSAQFNKYNYQNVKLEAKINQGAFDAHVVSNDKNAQLNLVAQGEYKTDLKDVKLSGTVDKMDLNELGFYDSPLAIAGEVDANFDDLNIDALNGQLYLKNFAIADDKGVLPLSEISLVAISTADSNQLQIKSQVADAEMKGKFKLTQIASALTQTLNQYYHFQKDTNTTAIEPHQYFTFNAQIKDDDLIRKFLPELTRFDNITLNGKYDADSQQIFINGEIPKIVYAENQIENGVLTMSNSDGQLNYQLKVGTLNNESFKLNKIDLNGDIANNSINVNASTKDEKDQTQFLVAAQVNSLKDLTQIHLKPNGLILNYDQWQVSEENSINLLANGFVANDFQISNGESQIIVNSESNSPSSPLNIEIKDFKIETITELIKKQDLPAAGIINGTAQIRDLNTNMTFNADINVTDLEAFGQPVGNVTAKLLNSSAENINADVKLTGNNNDLSLVGNYNTKASAFDMDLNINRLEMNTIQGFTMNMIHDTEGHISGQLDIKGSIDEPQIRGQMKFNQVGLTLKEYGSNFRNIDDAIDFTSKGIEFNRFRINDNDGNTLTLNGDILTKNYSDFDFDLTANGRDFKVINSEESADALTYGVLAVNANLQIKGNLDLPVVSGTLAVTDETNFTFVLPQSNPSLEEREGIVEFIDQDKIALQETITEKELKAESRIKGFNVSVNIEIDKEAKTSIVIDKANGDFVELQGEAELTGGMDPSGKITLVGVYQVEKGAYEMSVSLLKRRFDIQKGSTITWTGEPTTATLDITAIYQTNAAPIDLIEQQLTGLSASETNMYKQRIPFNTNLILKGELLKPEISFDITLNEDNPSIATAVIDNTKSKLDQLRNDEAEMNKQVISLLLLNRFIGENPFQSQSGISAETMAKQSVSNIVSQQLNNLAADLITGVDIDFGLNTDDDYSTGSKNTRTDLNVAVSKRLLDDRLKVSIGSNFGLEGDARENENMTNIAGDISVDYSLSRDGRYMIRAYRKNEYQVALQGQIIETGVGFIITLDYDHFKEIFEKRKRNRTYRKMNATESK